MNTKVLRIDMAAVPDVGGSIAEVCDRELAQGFKLAATFVWLNDLVLIFQKV